MTVGYIVISHYLYFCQCFFWCLTLIEDICCYEEETFITKRGIPTGTGGVVCIAAARRLRPDLTFEQYCEMLRNNSQAKATHVSVKPMVEGTQTPPVLTPAGEVLASTKYGYEIYTKCAAMTDTELQTHTGKTAAQLGLKPFVNDYAGPDSSSKLFLVSLSGMSTDMRDSVRRVKIRHETAAHSHEYWLTPPDSARARADQDCHGTRGEAGHEPEAQDGRPDRSQDFGRVG